MESHLTDGLEERARVLIKRRDDIAAFLQLAGQAIEGDLDGTLSRFRQIHRNLHQVDGSPGRAIEFDRLTGAQRGRWRGSVR